MAEIRPFQGIRYDLDRVGGLREVLGPADDIPSAEEASTLVACHPYHSVRLEMLDPATPANFCRSAAYLRRWLRQGILRRDPVPAFYAHEHEYRWGDEPRIHRGLFAVARLGEPAESQVLPHESTNPEMVAVRISLLDHVKANLSAIYTLIDDGGRTLELARGGASGRPTLADRGREGDAHRLWMITDPERIAALQEAVAGQLLYIADGHHRYAAALAYRDRLRARGIEAPEADWVLTYIADVRDPGITVRPFHRVFRSFGRRSWDEARQRMAHYFQVEERELSGPAPERRLLAAVEGLDAPGDRPSFVVLDPGGERYALLRLRDWARVEPLLPRGASEVTRRLDVTLLDRALLRHALGYTADDLDKRIEYLPDAGAAFRQVRAGVARAAVFLRPTPLDSLLAVARAGERMPYKSTSFYPKIPIGLLFHDLRDGDGAA